MGFIIIAFVIPTMLTAVFVDWYLDDSSDEEDSDENTNNQCQCQHDENPAPQEPEEPAVEGQLLYYHDAVGEVLNGTDGDDTLLADQGFYEPYIINLHDGDDFADIFDSTQMDVFGGKGDDTILGIDAISMYGGSGDDHLIFDNTAGMNDRTPTVDGGAGDDTIHILNDTGADLDYLDGAYYVGGDGSDHFHVKLKLINSLSGHYDDLGGTRLGVIRDFDPNIDALVVEIDRNSLSAGREGVVEFSQTEDNGVYRTNLLFRFESSLHAFESTTSLGIISQVPFTLDDIQITGLEAWS